MNGPQLDADSIAIRETVSDYYGGWYEANKERMARCLHPGLAKRAVRREASGKEYLHHLGREDMVRKTAEGGGSDTPPALRKYEVTILDRYEEMAAVKVVANEYIDYLHVARHDGRWLIVNALWTDNRDRK
jgi:hypothetical protein